MGRCFRRPVRKSSPAGAIQELPNLCVMLQAFSARQPRLGRPCPGGLQHSSTPTWTSRNKSVSSFPLFIFSHVDVSYLLCAMLISLKHYICSVYLWIYHVDASTATPDLLLLYSAIWLKLLICFYLSTLQCVWSFLSAYYLITLQFVYELSVILFTIICYLCLWNPQFNYSYICCSIFRSINFSIDLI